jgi:uncharacterized membrane protein YkgB
VYLWFGALKLFDVSPVVDVIRDAYPFFVSMPLMYRLLAIVEVALGAGILIPRFARLSAFGMLIHLFFATFGVLLSPQAFLGGFPFLSIVGEFVVKNVVLIAALLLILREHHEGVRSVS